MDQNRQDPTRTKARRTRRIFSLALPIIGGMVSQNLLNLVDTAMVGKLGDPALAAVGLGGFVNFLTSAFVLGIAAGVQAICARRQGAGLHDSVAVPLNGGLLFSLVVAVPWSLLLVLLTPTFFPWLTSDAQVLSLGVPYLQVRIAAMVAMAMNFSFRAFWNASNQPGCYLRTLLVMHAANIVLNWVLIFGHLGAPAMGVTGAGLASAIATYLGTLVHLLLAFGRAREAGFLRRLPSRETFRTMLRLAIPAGVQQSFFAGGMTAFMWIVGRVGTEELAATNVLLNLLLIGVLPGLGFGLASASLVGQSLGAGRLDEARSWGWAVARIAMVFVGAIVLPAIFVPEQILGVFLHEAQTLDMAVAPLRLISGLVVLDSVGLVLMHSLMGAGDTRRTMIVSIVLQWAIFLPLLYLIGPVWKLGLLAIWGAHFAYRLVQTGVFMWMWQGSGWTRIEA